jgi:hypothetical protein
MGKKKINMFIIHICVFVLCAGISFFVDTDISRGEDNQEEVICEDWETEYNPGSIYNMGESVSLYRLRQTSTATDKYYDQLDEESQAVYEQMYEAYKDGPCYERVSFEVLSTWEESTWEDEAVSISNKTLSLTDDSKNEIFQWVRDVICPAYLALLYDCPECGWLSVSSYKYSFSYTAKNIVYDSDSSDDGAVTGTADITVTSLYLTISEQDITVTKSDIDSAVETAVESINSGLSAEPDRYEIIKGIHDYLCNNIAYADDTSLNMYQSVYSAFYDVDDDGIVETVCAGYAKAFKLLCGMYDIPAVVVSGTGVTSTKKESHMWNYVKMEDDKWYAVDTTWDDQTEKKAGKIFYDFLLVGAETVDTNFGGATFAESHVSNGNWSANYTYIFQYPVITESAYVYHTDKDGDAICDICGKLMDDMAVRLAGWSLGLAGDIGLNCYVQLGNDIISDSDTYMKVSAPGGSTDTIALNEADIETVNGNKCYKFTYHVAAKEMTDNISMQLYISDNQAVGDKFTYSVADYTEYILANETEYSDEIPLVKAMLRYGAAAQRYFNYNENYSADSILPEADREVQNITSEELASYERQMNGELPEGLNYYGSSLVLNSSVSVKHYFTVDSGYSITDYEFEIDGQVVKPIRSGAYYCIYISDIDAQNYDKSYTLIINNSYRITYGAFSYVYSVLGEQSDNELMQLVKALTEYGMAVDEYINKRDVE